MTRSTSRSDVEGEGRVSYPAINGRTVFFTIIINEAFPFLFNAYAVFFDVVRVSQDFDNFFLSRSNIEFFTIGHIYH
ncbi:hypothetical protein IH992_15605 [Candidatus Poribacteria bacterium]|nr:hypothetical protein [Candidatus Poribacteria bacterium]